MAVENTGAMYKAFTFDGESSRNYGVYITGEAVYNAPERDIEMVSIPGRNGSYALDRGRFQNIEVTYPAGIFASTESDFADVVSDFRNMLCSRTGYCRLADEYNPNEYRLAIYKSGLEVTPTACKAGEFEITFECKPQRYLTSGESAVAVADGGTITNPTLYASNPILQVTGYGDMNVNGYDITLTNEVLGTVEILSSGSVQSSGSIQTIALYKSLSLSSVLYNASDVLSFGAFTNSIYIIPKTSSTTITSFSVGSHTGGGTATASSTTSSGRIKVSYDSSSITSGTSAAVYTSTTTANVSVSNSGTTYTGTVTIVTNINYVYNSNGSDTLEISVQVNISNSLTSYIGRQCQFTWDAAIADSTVSILGTPTYIDCDLGEAYKIENNSVIDLNSYIDLGSDLPKLSPGSNAVTYDNTVTDFKIVPNWWQL